MTIPRRPSLDLPLDLGVGLVTAALGVWIFGSTWGSPFSVRAAAALVGGGLVALGAFWTAGGVRQAR